MKKDITVRTTITIKEALKKLDKTAEKTLVVIDENNKLLGTLTDGDIRRHIIKTGNIEGVIEHIYNKNPIFLTAKNATKENIKNALLKNRIELLPIVDEYKTVIKYATWAEVFIEEAKPKKKEKEKLNIPVVIMAGGKGTRLSPYTQILPKPLIPLGDKTMIEYIIHNFLEYGIKTFFLTLNYKGELIEAYFKGIEKDYDINFVWEKEFLGTAGSLKLLEETLNGDFIVSNCDILVNANFYHAYEFHKKNNSVFTSITSIQHYKIPYGVVNIKSGGLIEGIEEKPEYTFQINTGVYILNSKVLKYIPKNRYFDMPELIKQLIDSKESVFAYPVNESEYIDMGQWKEYKKALKILE